MLRMFITPGPDNTECLYQNAQWQQECRCGSEKYYGISLDPEEEDASDDSSCSHMGTRSTAVDW